MKFNLRNFIDTNVLLGKSHGLHPVYEAIANSIDAIADRSPPVDGKITVRVLRDMAALVQTSTDGGKESHPITGFEIEDNGEGFTDRNLKSFQHGSDDNKKQRGGKGLGRFSWLKVFGEAKIVSVYQDGKTRYSRTLIFTTKSTSGIKGLEKAKAKSATPGTTVCLTGMKKDKFTCPKKPHTIARHIIEHHLVDLLSHSNLSIILEDPENDDGDLVLRDILRDEYVASEKDTVFNVGGYDFTLRHVIVKSMMASNQKHRVMFCAKNRAVETHLLAKNTPQLGSPLMIDGLPRVYLGMLTGEYFEQHVSPTRTFIQFDDESASELFGPLVTLNKVMDAVRDSVVVQLNEPLQVVRKATEEKVTSLINGTLPEYRAVVLRNPSILDRLSPNSTESEIVSTVVGEQYKERKSYLENINSIREIANAKGNTPNSKELLATITQESLDKFYKGSHQEAVACMIKFVHHRAAVLDLLNLYLGTKLTGSHEREDAIHNLIFPMKKTSDQFPVEESNLWVLDERLIFHHYLASDLPFADHDVVESESQDRPDVVVYNTAPNEAFWDASFAFGDQENNASSVTIVEFKKPDRDRYTDVDNPYEQVKKYVKDIRAGREEDRTGRRFPKPDQLRFFAYVALDVTDKLIKILMENDFNEMIDGDGYFKVDNKIRLYTEIMSYQKMVEKAKSRNDIYLEHLRK